MDGIYGQNLTSVVNRLVDDVCGGVAKLVFVAGQWSMDIDHSSSSK